MIQGSCDPRFERVREAFAEGFASRGEHGAAVAIRIDGKTVLDLRGGFVDKEKTRPWQPDTIATVFSVTKGLTAACLHALADDGKIDIEAPVARYWPEFAAAGKESIPVRFLLDHRAGLPAIRAPLPPEALYDWNVMTNALAAETPWWTPGTKHGYHAITFGWLVGELVRRVSGKSVGAFFRERFAKPLELDTQIGIPPSDDARCTPLRWLPRDRTPGAKPTLMEKAMADPEGIVAKAFANPPTTVLPQTLETREWRGGEVPSVNGHTTALGLAKLYGAFARGEALSRTAVDRARAESSSGHDEILDVTTRFGLGYMLSVPGEEMGPSEGAFGHPGAGGSLGFADPTASLGFGYVTNRLGTRLQLDPRAKALIAAVYASL
jgi:CubicO group peptidase (beta-lactamase class C family)